MAPTKKSGRAQSSGTPPVARDGPQGNPQEPPQRTPTSARRGSRQTRARPSPYAQPGGSPTEVPTPTSATQGELPIRQENSSFLQGQISELSEQVHHLTSLLQNQAAQLPATTVAAQSPPAGPLPPTPTGHPASGAASPVNDASPFIDAIRLLSDSGSRAS